MATFEDSPPVPFGVVVSRRSHEQDVRPRFVYHETPVTASDSGWCVLVGDETSAELDDPSTCVLLQMDSVLDRWPELRPVFESGAPDSEWEWDETTEKYVPYIRQT